MIDFINEWWMEVVKITIEVLLIVFLVKFGYKSDVVELQLTEGLIEKIIRDFKPAELVDDTFDEDEIVHKEAQFECADYDFFDFKNNHKKIIHEVVKKYGVGTCGPRGFYGTLDLHVDLEKRIANIFGTEDSILYSNSFSCISSILLCFCKSNDLVYYHSDCNESILRGITVLKSSCYVFHSIEDLNNKIISNKAYRNRIFVVVEGLYKNTGEITNIVDYINLKYIHKFRLIVDETFSFPLLGPKGVSSFYETNTNDIDIIIGSLAHVFCGNGAFSTGKTNVIEYQRLNSISYCFSASMPGFITEYCSRNLQEPIDLCSLNQKVKVFFDNFRSKNFKICSPLESPLITIVADGYIDEESVYLIRLLLLKKSIRISVIEGLDFMFRVVLKKSYTEKDIKYISEQINDVLDMTENATLHADIKYL